MPFLLVAAGGFWMLLRRHWAVTAALVLPLVLTAVLLVAGGLTFSPRFFLLALPVAILAAVEGIYWAVVAATRAVGGRRATAGLVATALVIAVTVMSVVPLRRYYSVPKQPYRAAIRYAEAARSGNGIVIAIHLAERGYLYYGQRLGLRENRDFFLARTVERLDQILSAHPGRPVYLVTTLEPYMRIELPELKQRIVNDWTIAETFPATVGDGAISVWKPRAGGPLR